MQLESARHRLKSAARAPLAVGSMALDVARRASPELAAASFAAETGGSSPGLPGSNGAFGSTGPAGSGDGAGAAGAGIPMMPGTPPGPEWEAIVRAGEGIGERAGRQVDSTMGTLRAGVPPPSGVRSGPVVSASGEAPGGA